MLGSFGQAKEMNRYFGGAKEPKANEHIIWEPHYEAQIPLQWDCIPSIEHNLNLSVLSLINNFYLYIWI